jgi:hypothetical protein
MKSPEPSCMIAFRIAMNEFDVFINCIASDPLNSWWGIGS